MKLKLTREEGDLLKLLYFFLSSNDFSDLQRKFSSGSIERQPVAQYKV